MVIVVGILEWKINLIVFKFGFGNRNRCFENRVGGSMFYLEFKNGGVLEFFREIIVY